MSTGVGDRAGEGPVRYRIELEGDVGDGLRGWIETGSIRGVGRVTVIELGVEDQAQLHGVLRRLHDLHLGLVGVTRIGRGAAGGDDDEA